MLQCPRKKCHMIIVCYSQMMSYMIYKNQSLPGRLQLRGVFLGHLRAQWQVLGQIQSLLSAARLEGLTSSVGHLQGAHLFFIPDIYPFQCKYIQPVQSVCDKHRSKYTMLQFDNVSRVLLAKPCIFGCQ